MATIITDSVSYGAPWSLWLDSTACTTSATIINYGNTSSTTSGVWTWTDSLWLTWSREAEGVRAATEAQMSEAAAAYRESLNHRIAEREAQRVAAAEVARSAERKAEQLLIGHLTHEQREQYKKERAFVVHGRSGRRYRIRYGSHGNIDVIGKDGRGVSRLCVQPAGVPIPDVLLTQALWLEHNEKGILDVANASPWCPAEPVLPPLPAATIVKRAAATIARRRMTA